MPAHSGLSQLSSLDAPIGNARLSEQIYERLKAAITSGKLEPGVRLREQEIGHRLSVSQAPVREALTRLTRERMVIQMPRRGSFVAEISQEEARHAYQVRIPLERVAAELACRNGGGELVADLEADLGRLREAAAADDVAAMVEADASFHRRVWHAGGNPLLPDIWAMVEGCMRGFTVVSNRLYYPDLSYIAETHMPLVQAIAAGEPARAADLFEEHAVTVWQRIEDARP
ncbi:GntR family transcriptional regulator [Streptomyces sulphureus]|uniref:GntR family transcriptional regulator n=1 Tax=Streptomyces sulphureus TaxID=47758 RepID=UPI000376853A|nr:GntR family transcriptional regulator [Streptomyces sulphureus]